MKEYFYYLRDKAKKPIVTVCLIMDDDNYDYDQKTMIARGVSICSRKDNPSKKRGRDTAEGRAIRALNFLANLTVWSSERRNNFAYHFGNVYYLDPIARDEAFQAISDVENSDAETEMILKYGKSVAINKDENNNIDTLTEFERKLLMIGPLHVPEQMQDWEEASMPAY